MKMPMPVINCTVGDALFHAMPNMQQMLLEFDNTVYPSLTDSLLKPHRIVVHWLEVGAIWWPQIQWNEKGLASFRSRTMERCPVGR